MYHAATHLHFVGIGGVGMAGIAEVLRNLGYSVSGSDLKESALVAHLRALGIPVIIGHQAENVPRETTTVVISAAVNNDNPEIVEATCRQIPVIPRAEMLAELMRMKYGVAIAGAHGKTTTTTMTAKVLSDIGLDPTVIIGGRVLTQESGARLGTGKYLVAEADESDGSFCLLRPAIAVVTNIDAEHLNHYGSFGKLEEAFFSFLSSIPFYGVCVLCFDDPILQRLAAALKRRVTSYGLNTSADISATDVVFEGGASTFTVLVNGHNRARITLPMPGCHMVSNALAAIAVGLELGGPLEQIAGSLQSFPGVARRSEVIGRERGVTIIDDYGHHPTEIAATLQAIRHGYVDGGRLFVLFQPHRYSRTKDLFTEFLTAFDAADEVVLSDIYPAGEEAIPGVTAEKLAQAMQHRSAMHVSALREALPSIVARAKPGDVIVTLGAGSIGALAQEVVLLLRDRRIAAV